MNTIQSKYNISSCSRNKTIRYADDMARKVNVLYPRISASKVDCMKNIDKFKNLPDRIWNYTNCMRSFRYEDFEQYKTFQKKIMVLLEYIKAYRAGNCCESADLGMLIAKANGIDNCEKVCLVTPSLKEYDHAVVLVKDKKPYIIDTWLGFADYLPKAIERYQKDFRHCFDFDKLGTEKMHTKKVSDLLYTNKFLNKKFSENELNILKETYPELIKNKNF